MKHISYYISLIILLTFLLSSCWTSKKVITQQDIKAPSLYILDSVKNNYLKYKNLSIKFNSKFESTEKNLSFSGQIRMKRDSIIWITVSPALGIEAIRLVFTPDSVKMLNRLTNNYLAESYDLVTRYTQTEINFNFLQSLFLNELIPYEYNADVKILENYIMSDDSVHIVLTNSNSGVNDTLNKNIIHLISILKNYNKIDNISTFDNASMRNLKINYSEFQTENAVKFPTSINLVLKNKDDFINLSINYTKITEDNNLNFPFNIPGKYERIKY